MRIRDLLDIRSIDLNGAVGSKEEALNAMVDLMVKSEKIDDVEVYRKGVFAREEEGTTGIGEGIAIPHCKSDSVNAPGLAAMVVKDGVEFDSLDGEPVHILFLIAAPNTKENVHLDVLSKLSMLLMDESFTQSLINSKSVDEFLGIIDDAESAKDEYEATKDTLSAAPGSKSILAVTACPTGIAHTYMAAEAIEKKAMELGYSVKVETRGSGGAKNVLTDEEIKNADGIIVAADTKVPMDRFDGHKVVIAKVAEGINKTEELIDKALSGDVPVYHSSGADASEETQEKESGGRVIYKHLMSGVSHMLPFVIGGGILVALAFLVDTLTGNADVGSAFGSATPLSAFLNFAGGKAMGLMVPVLAGFIAYSIADRPGLAVGFTGGLLASSGNAILSEAGYIWADNTTGFMKFISDFAFQQTAESGNTVSGFLGGIVAGFLAGYIILLLKKVTANFPPALDGIKPTLIYPLCGILIISILMCFIFNPIIGAINSLLSEGLKLLGDSGLLPLMGLIVGGMMAIDMGGPINKAAYVFGTMMLSTAGGVSVSEDPSVLSCYVAMASVMVGGMVPPVGIALATLIFPKKFTKAEKGSTVSSFIMGAGFITEAAIPFAAADPLHVIPATFIGSAVAGGLSALFQCTLMAPHGGIFVFATVGRPVLYILSWLIGSAVTCLLLGILKKDVE